MTQVETPPAPELADRPTPRRWTRRRTVWAGVGGVAVLALVGGVVVARSGSPARYGQPPSATFVPGISPPGAANVPLSAAPLAPVELPAAAATDPAAALTAFLRGRGKRSDLSYALLSQAGRTAFPSLALWQQAQVDEPAPTALTLAAPRQRPDGATEIDADVRFNPALDQYAGFTPAEDRETWRLVKEAGGWRVDPSPTESSPVLPDPALARGAVQAWLDRSSVCDQRGAGALQAQDPLFVGAVHAEVPCQERGSWTAGAVGPVPAGPQSGRLVAAFGDDVVSWGRIVPASGPHTRLLVAVAPLGATWKVMDVEIDARPTG